MESNNSIVSSLVSIVIPVYNAEKYIQRCLDSVVNQNYSNLDIIIIDDGSTDNSASVIENYLNDDRIRFIKKENSGPSDTRNRGIEEAKGDFICFADADDYLDLDYVSVFLNAFTEYELPDLIVTGYWEYSIYNPDGISIQQMEKESLYTVNDFLPYLFKGTMGVLWGKLFKTEIIKNANLRLDSSVRFQEDLLFVFSYLQHCKSMVYKSQVTYHYNRLNETSLTGKLQPYHIGEFEKVQNALLSLTDDVAIKRMVQDRELPFYQQYIISLANHFGFKQFCNSVKQIDYKKYSKFFQGKKVYAVFFLLMQKGFIILAYHYMKTINYIKILKQRL